MLTATIPTEQEVIRYIEKLAWIFRLDKQNAEVYSALFDENRTLKKQLEDYHFQYNTLEKRVKRLEKDVKFLETVYLDECVDRETVVKFIQELILLPNIKKMPKNKSKKGEINFTTVDFYKSSSSESSKDSDSVEIIERSHKYQSTSSESNSFESSSSETSLSESNLSSESSSSESSLSDSDINKIIWYNLLAINITIKGSYNDIIIRDTINWVDQSSPLSSLVLEPKKDKVPAPTQGDSSVREYIKMIKLYAIGIVKSSTDPEQ
ncbi:hypothetical protein RclHR1_12760004 [Rhizophagus clarus]|uniref:Uncharacterized protein n=1 Tax=Rhizophagus clarus TaxID=94130 RepID=A0A2Z6R105_9GLOM|nr:hypothetical protein RclHR1_12760004 [Rhizophagus clarus]